MCNMMQKLKEEMLLENVGSYQYIPTRDNSADLLTKRKSETTDFYGLFLHGTFDKASIRKVVKLVKREHAWEICLFKPGKEQEGASVDTIPAGHYLVHQLQNGGKDNSK